MTAAPPTRFPAEAFVLTVLAYVLAHGLTAFLITPVQARLLPEVTVFASLVYLPHGVRVLATWLMGVWWGTLALLAGSYIAHILFTPASERDLLQPALLESLAVGAVCAPAAFGLLRLLGLKFPASNGQRMRWTSLMLLGAVSSILNSIGQSVVYSGLIVPAGAATVFAIYALGDMIGLVVCMVATMLIFRWMRVLAR